MFWRWIFRSLIVGSNLAFPSVSQYVPFSSLLWFFFLSFLFTMRLFLTSGPCPSCGSTHISLDYQTAVDPLSLSFSFIRTTGGIDLFLYCAFTWFSTEFHTALLFIFATSPHNWLYASWRECPSLIHCMWLLFGGDPWCSFGSLFSEFWKPKWLSEISVWTAVSH